MSRVQAQKAIRYTKARQALFGILWDAMWDGEPHPPPKVPAPLTPDGAYINEMLHEILGFEKPWWKRVLGL